MKNCIWSAHRCCWPSEPPRLLYPEDNLPQIDTVFRRWNLWLLGGYSIQTSVFPSAAEGLQTQRTRWEHGHLGVIVTQVPRLFWQALTRANGALFAMALDLCVPPLALLTMLTVGSFAAGVSLAVGGVSVWPALLSSLVTCMLILAVMLAWWRFGRSVISLKQLCHVPLYVAAKLPLYFYFLVKRQSAWVRSKRDGEL